MTKTKVGVMNSYAGVVQGLDVTCDKDEDLVEVRVDWRKRVMWVNVNGECVFRMCRVPEGTAWVWDDEPFEKAFGRTGRG